MAQGGAEGQIAVVILFQGDLQILKCDQRLTMAQVCRTWQDTTGLPISVAFFAQGGRHLPADTTISQALTNPSALSLDIRAYPKSKYWLKIFGRESSNTLFEVAPTLTPADVRRDIGKAVEIYADDSRLTYDGDELDPELPFNQQGLDVEAQLMIDLRVIVKVNFEETNETKTLECYCSDSVYNLRQRLNCNDDIALISAEPHRHLLEDSLNVCHIVSDVLDLEIPIYLSAEQKVMLTFEPITLDHLQQKMPVALSCTPFDIYNLVRERFQLKTEFRLAVNGHGLDNFKPLLQQLADISDVIQIDILRPFVVSDMWKGIWDKDSIEEVYLYSTESSHTLYLWDELSEQRLYYDDINLVIFGSVVDVFGAISGKEKPLLLVDRDVQRNFPMLTFDGVMQRLGWARDMMIDVVPIKGGLLPKEVMHSGNLLPAKSMISNLRLTEDSLTILDPEKVFISSDKSLHICRFARESVFGDVRDRLRQMKGSHDIGLHIRHWNGRHTFKWKLPDEAMNRKLDQELLFLSQTSRCKTQMTVTMNNQWFSCRFEAQQVRFTDIMVNIAKQAKVMPRRLFSRNLYCCGCSRQLSMEEEPHQMIPANCCRVKSLTLTDRRMKDVGVQSTGSRRRDVATLTLDSEAKDICAGKESVYKTAIIDASPDFERAATSSVLSTPFRIQVLSPVGELEKRNLTVEGSKCRDLLAAADRQLSRVPLGDSPLLHSEEVTYVRKGEERRALHCFDEEEAHPYVDQQDGKLVNQSSWLCISRRFLRPSSPLPSSPSLKPYVFIDTETDFLSITQKRQLQDAPSNALTDPSFLAWLWGIRSGKRFFWKLADSYDFITAESDQARAMEQIPGSPKRHVVALLRDNDPVPRAKVPAAKCLEMFRRANFELRIEKACVRCARQPQLIDIDLWTSSSKIDAFDVDFAAAARK